MRTFRYGNILKLSTLQFDGHVHAYFKETAKKLVAFYILPRGGEVKNFIEVYEQGKLKEKKSVYSPKDIALAYIMYYLQYLTILFAYFGKNEKISFINTLPVFFFFNSFIKRFRNLEITYWVQDYWPINDLTIRIFRFFMYYYHARVRFTLYVSDRINRVMNGGKLRSELGRHTVMLGTNTAKMIVRRAPRQTIVLCLVGVLKESQGVDLLLETVARNSTVSLKLIGTGEARVVNTYKEFIRRHKIGNRIFFPNRFYYGDELKAIISDCHVGLALYTVDPNAVTYYADPAKIKHYAELGLPIIMTNAAEVADYIKRFKAGIIVKRNVEAVSRAIKDMKENYSSYLAGLRKFNEYFNYRTYYKKAFRFLETS